MARLQQHRVGFKTSGRIGKPGIKISSNTGNKASKKVLERRVFKSKLNKFSSTLKPKEKIAFQALIKEINSNPKKALADIYSNVSKKLNTKEQYFAIGLFQRLYQRAVKEELIISK